MAQFLPAPTAAGLPLPSLSPPSPSLVSHLDDGCRHVGVRSPVPHTKSVDSSVNGHDAAGGEGGGGSEPKGSWGGAGEEGCPRVVMLARRKDAGPSPPIPTHLVVKIVLFLFTGQIPLPIS